MRRVSSFLCVTLCGERGVMPLPKWKAVLFGWLLFLFVFVVVDSLFDWTLPTANFIGQVAILLIPAALLVGSSGLIVRDDRTLDFPSQFRTLFRKYLPYMVIAGFSPAMQPLRDGRHVTIRM